MIDIVCFIVDSLLITLVNYIQIFCQICQINSAMSMASIPKRKPLPWESKVRTGFQEHNRKTDPRYHSTRWRKLRLLVMQGEPLCRECASLKIVKEATDLDHIIPAKVDDSLFWEFTNLQPLCSSHHKSKSAKEKGVTNG